MRKLPLIILCLLMFETVISAQQSIDEISYDISRLYNNVVSSSDDNIKFATNDSIKSRINDYASSVNIFSTHLNDVKFIGEITSPDNKLKIINWNLLDTKGVNHYFCFLIHRNGKKSNIYYLEGSYNDEKIDIDAEYNSSNWYGALYYDIQNFKFEGKEHYLILGYDYSPLELSRKIVETLSFSKDEPLFGHYRCLSKENKSVRREVLEYSSDGIVTLRFVSKKSVVFDHLAAYATGHTTETNGYGAALSFDAYQFEKGMWHFISNVDIRNTK